MIAASWYELVLTVQRLKSLQCVVEFEDDLAHTRTACSLLCRVQFGCASSALQASAVDCTELLCPTGRVHCYRAMF